MAETRRLDELFRVAERFRRSVNVALDYEDAASLDGYVITPLSTAVLSRIASGLGPSSKNRSWSITGPYGVGKSACMLFLSQMLGFPPRGAIRAIVREDQPALYRQALAIPGWEQGGFVVVPMVCSRQPLSRTLLSGLLDTLGAVQAPSPSLAQHTADVQALHERVQQDDLVPSVEIAKVVEKTAGLLQAQEPSVLGIIVVLDELGKSLEYAALNPERGDIELLQILAEMASRSVSPVVGLLTVLHQAFEHYAASLSPVQQREWNKVQGRFEDVGFFQSPGELLGLVSKSIEPQSRIASLNQMIAAEARQAGDLEILPRDLNKEQALQIIAGCAPLHPTAALAIGPLFRSRLAQNERSLFAFLCSGEPHGFQDFLHSEAWTDNGYRPFYRLDKLYDYVLAALGSGLYAQAQGKHWAEIGEALERLPNDAAELDARLIKTIGMLGLLGDQRYLRASKGILTYALTDGHTTAQNVEESLIRLLAWKIAIHQRFKDAYGLWQGSDVDLDACFERGGSQVDLSASLARLLQRGGYLKPYVAKRHLHATGTLRFLVPVVTDLETLDQVGEENVVDADGLVAFVLPPPGMRLHDVTANIVRYSAELPSARQAQTLYAIPRHTQGIREALEEVMIWDWVTENTPELEGDSVARRELSARHLSARTRLERAISRCFDLSSSYTSCTWVWQGQERAFASSRALASFVSDVCDHVYSHAPIIRNELINRRSLSSAAAAARRALIERMLAHGPEENLGLEGYPPEMSIYLSVLKASGLHRTGVIGIASAQRWAFGPPSDRADPCHVQPLWQAVDDFLVATENGRRPITELFDLLKRPPFGVKEGPLPIYLAAVMLHGQAEIALYEEGTFIPQVRIAEFERLLRAPQRFALQRYRLTEPRARMLDGYIRLFNPKPEPGQVTMLNAVRALMGFAAQLPRHTQLTEDLSEDARAIRKALTSAREPQPLLFEALPAALGFGAPDETQAPLDAYLNRFRQALLELQQAYDRLLTSIARELLGVLHLPADQRNARQEIAQRASFLGNWISDLNLRAFALRLSDGQLTEREWLESVAAVVVSKPPANWTDADQRKYRVVLAQLAEQLRRVEEVALSKGKTSGAGRVLRIGVMDDAGQERRDVLRVAPEQEHEIERAVSALESALGRLGLNKRLELTALAELARRLLEDKSIGKDEHER